MNQNLKNKLKLAAVYGAGAMAIVLIQYFEGVKYKPYYDVGGVLSVCYGHVGTDIDKNKIYTEKECHQLLEKDLATVKQKVDNLIKVDVPETTRAALYSFVYNVGTRAFAESTLLEKLNSGNRKEACAELKRWIKADNKPWRGLMTRREIENELCNVDKIEEL